MSLTPVRRAARRRSTFIPRVRPRAGDDLATELEGTTVLVVEDDEDVRTSLIAILEEEGVVAIGAANGAEALEAMSAHAPDLVLLDLAMPVMDGWSFAARLRDDPAFAKTPIAVMSAGNNLARAPVSAAYLEKPIRRDALLQVLARLVR